MNIERGNVWNQFLVSSDLVSLYDVTKVLRFCGPFLPGASPAGETRGPSSGSATCLNPGTPLQCCTSLWALTHFPSSFHEYFKYVKTEILQCDNDKPFSSDGLLAYNTSCFNEIHNCISHIKHLLRAKDVYSLLSAVPFTRKVASSLGDLQPKWPLVFRHLPSLPMHSIKRYIWKFISALHYQSSDGIDHAHAFYACVSSYQLHQAYAFSLLHDYIFELFLCVPYHFDVCLYIGRCVWVWRLYTQ